MWNTNAKHLARLIMTTIVTTCSRRNLGKSRWRCEAVQRLLLAGIGRSLHSHLALIKQLHFLSTNWSGFLCVFLLCVFKRAVCESCKCEIDTILHQWLYELCSVEKVVRWQLHWSASVTATRHSTLQLCQTQALQHNMTSVSLSPAIFLAFNPWLRLPSFLISFSIAPLLEFSCSSRKIRLPQRWPWIGKGWTSACRTARRMKVRKLSRFRDI